MVASLNKNASSHHRSPKFQQRVHKPEKFGGTELDSYPVYGSSSLCIGISSEAPTLRGMLKQDKVAFTHIFECAAKGLCTLNQMRVTCDTILLERQKPVPDEFICPITLKVMKDPVTASDGFTYEREAITRVMESDQKRGVKRISWIEPKQALLDCIRNHEEYMKLAAAVLRNKSKFNDILRLIKLFALAEIKVTSKEMMDELDKMLN